MRPSCLNCARKHLAQALILLQESHQGYPSHLWLAIGHMAEASDELLQSYPDMANTIRNQRKRLEVDPSASIPFMGLIALVGTGGQPPVATPVPDYNPSDDPFDAALAEPAIAAPVGPIVPHQLDFDGHPAEPVPAAAIPATITAVPGAPCTPCQLAAKATAYAAAATAETGYIGRLILLTTLTDFMASYSLATAVLEQARAAAALGLRVHIWTMERCALPTDFLPPGVTVDPVIPLVPFGDDLINPAAVDTLYQTLVAYLTPLATSSETPVTIIDHDCLFQSAFVNLAAAMHRIGGMYQARVRWWHQAHSSVTSGMARDVTNLARQSRTTLPDGHRLLSITFADAHALAHYYDTTTHRVDVLRNSRDARVAFGMPANAAVVVSHNNLLAADVVQIMPLSATRLKPKGAFELVTLFAAMHRLEPGFLYRLVFVTAHANGPDVVPVVHEIKKHGRLLGLPERTITFTHETIPSTAAVGLGQDDIRALFQVSNLFAFPTVSEASSLVVLEAAQAGLLMVLNDNLSCMRDQIDTQHALWANWATVRTSGGWEPEKTATAILDALGQVPYRAKRQALWHASLDRYAVDLAKLLRIATAQPPDPD